MTLMSGPQFAPFGVCGIFAIGVSGGSSTNIANAMRLPSGENVSWRGGCASEARRALSPLSIQRMRISPVLCPALSSYVTA